MAFRFVPLGVGDAFSELRYSTCLALENDGEVLLVDCPHPLLKMLREARDATGLPLSADRIAGVVLTHLHADHSSGLDTFVSRDATGTIVLGATGGYLIGFIAAAAITGRLAEMGWDRNTLGAIAAMLIGNVAIYLVGVPWLAVALGVDLPTAIALGLTPFIVIDGIKLLAAAGTFRASWWVVGRRTGER